MRDLPGGTVTFLLTDVERSTALWEAEPEAMRRALARHDAIVSETVARHDGHLVKSRGEGDSAFAVFGRTSDGVAAACALQRALVAEPWPTAEPLRVRIALHTGPAELRDGDYFGSAVNRCARMRAIAHGGQVLLTGATARLSRDVLPDGASVRDLGLHRLRDLATAEQVFQLCHPGLPAAFPALRAPEGARGNLPIHLTSFVGRDTEVAAAAGLLGTQRLVTLTGAGGSGKTRLALRVAAEIADRFADGTWLVELGVLRDPDLIPHRVAEVLGVREERGTPLLDSIGARIRDRTVLLVLDNCEHLAAPAAALAEQLLRAGAEVRILATSRERLRVQGEAVMTVPPLDVPAPGDEEDRILRTPSVRLFAERAALARPGYDVTPDDAGAVATICRRLDGIPLALELAAARVRVLSVRQLADRLDKRFALLTGGHRSAPEHQRTLRATVDWSHEPLSERERVLFRRLAVFAGGFTLDQAEGVCAFEGLADCDVLDLVSRLLDRSLLFRDEDDRYRMLETVREYAAERLGEAGEGDAVRARHLGWFASFAERGEPELSGPAQGDWLDALEREHDNVREALRWGTDGAPEPALRLARAMSQFWIMRGRPSEGRTWIEAALERADGTDPGLVARAMQSAGALAYQLGDVDTAQDRYRGSIAAARRLGDDHTAGLALSALAHGLLLRGDHGAASDGLEEALSIARRLDDRHLLEEVLRHLGDLAHTTRDYQTARARYEEALAITRSLGDEHGMAVELQALGSIASAMRRYDESSGLYEESLAIARQVGDRRLVAFVLNALGGVAIERGGLDEATVLCEEALALRREIGDRPGLAGSNFMLGEAARLRGDLARAARHLGESLELFRSLGRPLGVGAVRVSLGTLALAQGALGDARAHLDEALATFAGLGDQQGIAGALEGTAGLAVAEAAHERAAVLLGAAEAIREAIGAPIAPSAAERREGYRDAARAGAGAEFEAAHDKGRAMTVNEAVAFARG